VLDPSEARRLLGAIDVTTPIGLRDRALIGLMVYSFARIGTALAMRVEDVFMQNRRVWVRLHKKGGKWHTLPCHHNLEAYLIAYIDGCQLGDDRKGPLFRTIGRGTGRLSTTPLPQANAFQMVGGAPAQPVSKRQLATIRFGRPSWPTMPRRGPRSSMIANPMT
jgi:integrase/recombinase XerC